MVIVHKLLLLIAATFVAAGQSPDRAPLADEWGYRPADGASVNLNPPSFSWVLEKGAVAHVLEWAGDPQFTRPTRVRDIAWTVYTHNAPLKPGKYWWRYRIVAHDGRESDWSRARTFSIPDGAAVFAQPTLAELKKRAGADHPRLFVRSSDLPKLKDWAAGRGKTAYERLMQRANELVKSEPTPEPTVLGDSRNPATRDHWWSNRVQTIKALQEAEVVSFAWLLTRDSRYGEAARKFTLKLAGWNPDGPTAFKLNCEAAKPMLHRLPRAYDWAYPLFTEEERARIRAVMLRRASDAWNSGEVRQAVGHLNQPYSSHGNRTWHKLAEFAIAALGETPEADQYLQYAVTKFFNAYPVWSDEDGGWHEGLSYLSGYTVKTTWWMHIAQHSLGIDPYKKPFFANIGDYAMYSAPPGTPDLGFGDLAFRPPSAGWSFLHYFTRRMKNPHWAWWLNAWNIPEQASEPVLDFIWSAADPVTAAAPASLPASKVFRGTGIAVMNSNLLDGRRNVQVRFKSSPMGRWSHGHDPHNSFTLNAYGVPLLVNNVYRDLYGTPFHKEWVWSTRAQNAVLVNGQGQKSHSADLGGRILKHEFTDGLDYVVGDATESYEGRLTRARRHVVFLKPDIVILADELEAPQPSTFQFMLHGQQEFAADETRQRLVLDRKTAGVVVDYVAPQPLKFRQWSGYTPEPDYAYLKSVNNPGIPNQWHVEAGTSEPARSALVLTVMQAFAKGAASTPEVKVERQGSLVKLDIGDATLSFVPGGAEVRRAGRVYKLQYPR
jgi:hypothetical protein